MVEQGYNSATQACVDTMVRRRIGYVLGMLLAFSLGFQMHAMGSYLFSPSGFQRTDNSFQWDERVDFQDIIPKPTDKIPVGIKNGVIPASSDAIISSFPFGRFRNNDVIVAQRYLHEPEVTSLLLDSVFNGTSCQFYTRHNKSHKFNLQDDTKQYFSSKNNVSGSCFVEGTRLFTSPVCTCLKDWYGDACSIPSSVQYSSLTSKRLALVKPRLEQHAKRIIHAFPFNIEFPMLEARLTELGDVVDVFLILESNYTAYGRHKPLRLLEMLCQGKYKRYANKIVHIFLDYFPKGAGTNGWISDQLHRDYISQRLRDLVRGYAHEDLFILTDADELPKRETLLFLKTHDGYPEPIVHSYIPTTYGFFWKSNNNFVAISSTVSMGILIHVLRSQCYLIRKGENAISANVAGLNTYLKSHNGVQIHQWNMGNYTHPSGWHCSWCFDPEGIQNKLVSAQNGDFPRWGDFPEKVKLKYISRLIATGAWFDEKTKFRTRIYQDDSYAPMYLMYHGETYSNILQQAWVMSGKEPVKKRIIIPHVQKTSRLPAAVQPPTTVYRTRRPKNITLIPPSTTTSPKNLIKTHKNRTRV